MPLIRLKMHLQDNLLPDQISIHRSLKPIMLAPVSRPYIVIYITCLGIKTDLITVSVNEAAAVTAPSITTRRHKSGPVLPSIRNGTIERCFWP